MVLKIIAECAGIVDGHFCNNTDLPCPDHPYAGIYVRQVSNFKLDNGYHIGDGHVHQVPVVGITLYDPDTETFDHRTFKYVDDEWKEVRL